MKYILIAAPLLLFCSANSGAQEVTPARDANTGAVQAFRRFEGTVTLQTKAPVAASVTVVKQNWAVRGRQSLESFPVTGLTIVHLHSGLVTTTIDGQEVKRNTGDYWTVPAGSQMKLLVSSESASLETLSIK
jgi:quercetin dioxygenase-like cupin family protein